MQQQHFHILLAIPRFPIPPSAQAPAPAARLAAHASPALLRPPLAESIPEYNIFGLQRFYSDLGGIRWAAEHFQRGPCPRRRSTPFLGAEPPACERLAVAAEHTVPRVSLVKQRSWESEARDTLSPTLPCPSACSRAAGSMGVPGLADELAEPMLFCEMMVFGRWAGLLLAEWLVLFGQRAGCAVLCVQWHEPLHCVAMQLTQPALPVRKAAGLGC